MSALVIPNIPPEILAQLRRLAEQNGRTVEEEARHILERAVPASSAWDAVNEFREGLAASGRTFSDSAELVREDRER